MQEQMLFNDSMWARPSVCFMDSVGKSLFVPRIVFESGNSSCELATCGQKSPQDKQNSPFLSCAYEMNQ